RPAEQHEDDREGRYSSRHLTNGGTRAARGRGYTMRRLARAAPASHQSLGCGSVMDATDLAFAGIARQAELVRDGEVSPRELVDLYLERIARLDPKLNSYRVVRGEQALAEAAEAEQRRGSSDAGPMNGVPVAIKDNQDVA